MADDDDGARKDPDLIGAVVAGRYKIVSKIARGGMGQVYKAEQSALGRTCALKVLSPTYSGEQDIGFHKRFSLEAATAAKLAHPNTVTIFDYGKDDALGVYFIAMEYLDGRTLHRALKQDGRFDEDRANRVAQQICRSLTEAHNAGVVHRDLKPGNVMLLDKNEEHDFVKVLDFGLVKDLSNVGEDLTQTGIFMGSPKYMAPEQITAGTITAKTDVYALGCMLYEMLVGKPPFERGAPMATLVAHVNEAPPAMNVRNPEAVVSPSFEALVMRCLEKQGDKRFASMRDLLSALKREAGDMTETADSLPRVRLENDAPVSRRSAPEDSGRSLMSAAASSLTLPASAAPAAAPARGSGLRLAVVVLAASLASGAGAAFVLSRQKALQAPPPAPEARRTVESASAAPVAVALPAAALAVTASNPAAGLRLVRIESEPSGARVVDRGTEVCMATPCEIVFRGEGAKIRRELTLSKAGFLKSTLVVEPDVEKASGKLELWVPTAASPTPPQEARSSKSSAAAETPAEKAAAAAPAAAAPPPVAVAAPAPAPAPEPAAPAPVAAPRPAAVMQFGEGMTRPTAIAPPSPVYTREAREAHVSGTVIAKCVITTSGSLTGCRIVKGVPFMDEAVLSALRQARYQPATSQGQAVAVDYVITLKLVAPP